MSNTDSNDVVASDVSNIADLNAATVKADGEGASSTPYEIDLAKGADKGRRLEPHRIPAARRVSSPRRFRHAPR